MSIRPPRLRELEIFRVLLLRRSVTETAERLGISQPAVSKTLRQLEAALGFRLFDRRRGRLHPTAEAEALLPSLDGVFASVAALSEAGAALRDGRGGHVAIAAVPSLANAALPAILAEVAARHPDLRLSVQVAVTRDIVAAVTRGIADIGLVHDVLEDPMLLAEELGAAAIGCVVPRGHAFAGRRMVEARDLKGAGYVSYPLQSPLSDRIAAAFDEVGEVYQPAIDVGASTAICAVVASTGLPGLVEDYVPALGWWPGLRCLPLAPPVTLRPRLLTARGRPASAPAVAVAEACRRIVMEMLTRDAVTRRRPPPARTAGARVPAPRPSGDRGRN